MPAEASTSCRLAPSASVSASARSGLMAPLSRRDPRQATPNREPSSSANTAIAVGRDGRWPAACSRATASRADTTPSGPSKAPPPGTESRCEPVTKASARERPTTPRCCRCGPVRRRGPAGWRARRTSRGGCARRRRAGVGCSRRGSGRARPRRSPPARAARSRRSPPRSDLPHRDVQTALPSDFLGALVARVDVPHDAVPGSFTRTRAIFSAASSVPSATTTWPAWMERPMPTPPPWWIETQVAPDAVLSRAFQQRPVGDGVGAVRHRLGLAVGDATDPESRWSRPIAIGALSSPEATISLNLRPARCRSW